MILDCTLRDGGYYNNWDFEQKTVEAYLKAVSRAKIDYVELGLRNFSKDGFLGAYAYTTEKHLNSLTLPEGPVYGVMVDAKTILSAPMSIDEAVDALFVPAIDSKIDLVRIAAHFNEVELSEPIVKKLKSMGYIVGYNLMQAGGKACNVITEKARQASRWGDLDVLYFADSLGNMDASEVERIVSAIRKEWEGPLGIHTHNNMGKGLDNTLTASSAGVSWLDVTITGMGRGAGNTQTENLLAVLDKGECKYDPEPIYDLAIRYFESMQKEYGWGSNLLYFLGAQNNVHPTYIQNLLSDDRYGADEIVGAIGYLSKADTTSYNGQLLEEALNLSAPEVEVSGNNLINNKFAGKQVLIIGGGSSVGRYKQGIITYIKEKQPVVIAININDHIDEELIDYYCISHNSKFLSEQYKYKFLSKPLILPKHRFTSEELQNISCKSEIFDYGLKVSEGQFVINSSNCIIPHEITTGYAMAIALNGNAECINLVGFDGYKTGDKRQTEMVELIVALHDQLQDAKVTALTPTSYPIKQKSVYAPNI